MELTARDQEILRATILYYIKSASPVGSRTLTKLTDLGLSPATIRNVMADLEELGFLSQPHTSAGRIPTEKAYRFYVDGLLESSLSPAKDSEFALLRLPPSEGFKETLHEASRLLSLLSRYAGVVVTPKFKSLRFTRVELVRLGGLHLLAIFVSADGAIYNRMVELNEELSTEQLRQISAELNQRFTGQDLETIRAVLLEEIREHKRRYDQLMTQIVEAAEASSKERSEDVYLEGKANIFEAPEFADVEKMKALFKTFEEKYRIMTLIDKSLETDGVHVFIGSENSMLGVTDLSLVMANYRCGEHTYGTLGVLGPTRMDYERVIPLVDRVATMLGTLLDSHARTIRASS